MEKEFLTYCPFCNKFWPQNLVYSHVVTEYVDAGAGRYADPFYEVFGAVCQSCKMIWVGSTMTSDYAGVRGDKNIHYPSQQGGLSMEVPPEVRMGYSEAVKVKEISPLSFAVMIRRSLEFICKEKGADGRKPLKKMIDELHNKKLIPEQLHDLSLMVKNIGNISAHANETTISSHDAKLLDDLFLAIVEYVYVAPAKLSQLKNRVQMMTGDQNEVNGD